MNFNLGIETDDKTKYFEYLVIKLVEWFESVNPDTPNDISMIKALKLTFFVTAKSIEINQENNLLDLFNNFHAMPYGHVESDIYNILRGQTPDTQFTHIKIDYRTTEIIKQPAPISCFRAKTIDTTIDSLKNDKSSQGIIKLKPFDLVDLSHQWYSWQKTFQEAKLEARNSKKIPEELIINERKKYHLDGYYY